MPESGNDSPVRIIVKKKKGHGGHHGGAWKVAYAVAGYFKDPVAFSEKAGSGGILPGGAKPDILPKPVEKKPSPEEGPKEIDRLRLEGKRIEGMISRSPVFDKFKDRIQVIVSEEGMRIELIENALGLFFDVGSANLKPETVALLKLLAKELGQLYNQIIIEGYTDARSFGTDIYTNWELSADRANRARKILEDNGLRRDQVLEVRGFADRKLKNPQDPMDASNRRVSIFLLPAPEPAAQGKSNHS